MHIMVLIQLHGFPHTCTGLIPGTVRSTVYVRSRLVAGNAVSNPATDTDVSYVVFIVYCVLPTVEGHS
jgi:hypothetical protein